MRRISLAIIITAIAFLLISCNSQVGNVKPDLNAEQSTKNTVATAEATSTLAIPTATPQLDSINGFKLPAEGVRPVAVMIDNEGTRSLPQGGLDMAQIIYEIIVEGGETRLMPVFWGVNPTMIGSVRSSRHYFLDYAMEHDAIYVHFGWSPMAQKDISALKINNINGITGGGVIFKDLTNDRNNWQDSYTSMEEILSYAKKVKYKTTTDKKPEFTYNQSNVEPASELKAEKVNLKYSSSVYCGFEYNKDTQTYKRFRKGKPQMERVSGKQLEATNILIQYTSNNTIKGDKAGRQEVKTVGSGNGYFITCGKAIKIKWSKQSRSAQTKYTDEAGKPITLNPGQTWIQIMPTSGKVTIE